MTSVPCFYLFEHSALKLDRVQISELIPLRLGLKERMVVLAQRAVEADIDELITIADELRELEERLVELDPDRAPLPPFEDASSERQRARKRRTPGRRRASAGSSTRGKVIRR